MSHQTGKTRPTTTHSQPRQSQSTSLTAPPLPTKSLLVQSSNLTKSYSSLKWKLNSLAQLKREGKRLTD